MRLESPSWLRPVLDPIVSALSGETPAAREAPAGPAPSASRSAPRSPPSPAARRNAALRHKHEPSVGQLERRLQTGLADAGRRAAEATTAGAGAPSSDAVATNASAPAAAPAAARLEGIPPRPADAATGSELARRFEGMGQAERERAIIAEIERGNVPEFLREFREVDVRFRDRQGVEHTGTVRVLPDYLALGSDADHIRVPLTPGAAQRIADLTGTTLPTPAVVDAVHAQADVRLSPHALSQARESWGTMMRHDRIVSEQRAAADAPLGALVAGHKKDVVNSARAQARPERVAIYGWHHPNGERIQPHSTVHHQHYLDYSHGVRLMHGTMRVDGREVPVAEVLADPELHRLLSREGPVRSDRLPNAQPG